MLQEDKRKQLDEIVQKMVLNKEDDSSVRFVVDDFKKKFDVPEVSEQKDENIPLVPGFAEPLVRGVAKVGEFLGFKPLGTAIAEGISGTPQTFSPKQVAGSALQVGLLATPTGLPKTLLGKTLQFAGIGAGLGLGRALEEDKPIGEAVGEAAKSAAITGALPIVGKGIAIGTKRVAKPIGEAVSSILGQFIGKPAEVIQKTFQDSNKVAQAMTQKKIPETIRTEAIQLLSKLKSEAKNAFHKGLEQQQKLHPFKKTGQILVKKEFGNIQTNVSRLLRENRVGVSGTGKLNFDKLASAIVSPSERKNVQLAIDTILSQKRFLPKDVQAVSARLGKLSKFSEGATTQASAIVRQIHSVYKSGLETAYPGLKKIRSEYAAEKKIYDELDNLLGVGKLKPTNITTAVKRLSNVFNEDNELYLGVLQKLEDKTGVDILAELAASEFSKLAPASFGSRVAQLGILGSAATGFLNPFILLGLPLFSPRIVGRATVIAGKAAETIPMVAQKLAPVLPKAAGAISR